MEKTCETCMYRAVDKSGAPCDRCKYIDHPGILSKMYDYWRWNGRRFEKKVEHESE